MSLHPVSKKYPASVLLATVLLTACNLQGVIPTTSAKELPKFESCEDISKVISNTTRSGYGYGRGIMEDVVMAPTGALPGAVQEKATTNLALPQSSSDFSRTNVQVEGVDEADTTKTDGKYIYTLSRNTLFIIQALPPDKMQVVGKISFDSKPGEYSNIQEFFVNGDNIAVFGSRNLFLERPIPLGSSVLPPPSLKIVPPLYPDYYPPSRSGSFIDVYNIQDPKNPSLKRSIEVEGGYLTSRMIGKNIYAVLNNYPQYYPPIYYDMPQPMPMLRGMEKETSPSVPEAKAPTETDLLPLFRDTGVSQDAKLAPIARCGDIHYVPAPSTAQYLTLLSFAIDNYSQAADKNITFGAGEKVYASDKSLYVARTDWSSPRRSWVQEILPMVPTEEIENTEKTAIYKFALADAKTSYVGEGSVKGTVLNQFSMDEYEGNFRIATTQHSYTSSENLSSNLFILDADLKPLGSITHIAPGETIYSARFMGKRGFLVTFKTVDPLFTFDLSDPRNPKTLGKLKIPGYSDYLHPYDENHLIGLGKEVNENIDADKVHSDNAVYYTAIQGVKLAIFDITDIEHPKEMYKEVIGDRGSDSPATQNHKAFLFDRNKNLLVIPVTVSEITDPTLREQVRNGEKVDGNFTTEFTFQGAYVYNLTLQNGFDLKGKISHQTDPEVYKKSGYSMGNYDYAINRSLYIDDHLYTLSNAKVMAHNFVNNLNQEGEVTLIPDTGSGGSTSNSPWVVE